MVTNPDVEERLDALFGALSHRTRRAILSRLREGEATEYHAEGIYREISPPEKLVFTHHWLTDDEPVETLITVELHEDGTGTRLVMRHEGLPTEKARDEHLSGWSSCYDRLVEMFS